MIHKYKAENMIRYRNHVNMMKHIPNDRIVYMDEVHFNPAQLHSKRAWAPVRQPARLVHSGSLGRRFSMTLFTYLYQPFVDRVMRSPLLYTIREDSNTASDFAKVLGLMLDGGWFLPGTYLVIDNAPVHNDNQDTIEVFERLAAAGVYVQRLPTYSPELNPCELVFAFLKNTLRSSPRRREENGRMVDIEFRERLNVVLEKVSRDTVSKFYDRCKEARPHLM